MKVFRVFGVMGFSRAPGRGWRALSAWATPAPATRRARATSVIRMRGRETQAERRVKATFYPARGRRSRPIAGAVTGGDTLITSPVAWAHAEVERIGAAPIAPLHSSPLPARSYARAR